MHRLKNMHNCNYDIEEEKVASELINALTAHSISNVKNLESLLIVFLQTIIGKDSNTTYCKSLIKDPAHHEFSVLSEIFSENQH